MKIMMIWVTDSPDAEEVWLVDAWDEDSVDNNPDGWQAALAKAHTINGAENVRVITATMNGDKVRQAFMATDAGELR